MGYIDVFSIGLVGLSVLSTGLPALSEPVAGGTKLSHFLSTSTAQDLGQPTLEPAPQIPAQTLTAQTSHTPPLTTSQTSVEETTPPTRTVDFSDALTAPNYLGVGGSLGIVEDTFGDVGAFAVISKLRLFPIFGGPEGSTNLSLRPSVIVGEDVTFVVPLTVDFVLPGIAIGGISTSAVVPYFGLGFTLTTDNDIFYFDLTGGLDVPIGQFTANAAVNVGFLDDLALGLTLGVGYNF